MWDVFTDYSGTGQLEVLVTSGIPLIGYSYETPDEYDDGAWVESIEPQQDGENPLHWVVTVQYSSDAKVQLAGDDQGDNNSGADLVANPLLKPVLVSYYLRNRKIIPDVDYSLPIPLPYTNSAGNGSTRRWNSTITTW